MPIETTGSGRLPCSCEVLTDVKGEPDDGLDLLNMEVIDACVVHDPLRAKPTGPKIVYEILVHEVNDGEPHSSKPLVRALERADYLAFKDEVDTWQTSVMVLHLPCPEPGHVDLCWTHKVVYFKERRGT